MIGIFLVFVAILLYFFPKYRYLSYFLYLSLMIGYGGGFGLWNDDIVGIKTLDLAIVYTFVINLVLLFNQRWKLPAFKGRFWLILFLVFLLASALFSFFYYGLSVYQIIQGSRKFLLVLSLPILIRATPQEVMRVVRLMALVFLITSVLYILQILVVRGPIMPYVGEPSIDSTTGLVRMYNFPDYLEYFIPLAFIAPCFFPKWIKKLPLKVIVLVALVCTLGRTMISIGLLTLFLALFLNGKAKTLAKSLLILGILLLPVFGMISERFEEGGTNQDLSLIMQGDFDDSYSHQGDATMLYRFAWCYERVSYLLSRPLPEQIFGLGLVSDSQKWVTKHYDFKIGLTNKETGKPTQMATPDISYGNMITYLGFGGAFIYLMFLISLTRFFWAKRKANVLLLVLSAYVLTMWLGAFSGSFLSDTSTLGFFFLLMSLVYHKPSLSRKESNSILER